MSLDVLKDLEGVIHQYLTPDKINGQMKELSTNFIVKQKKCLFIRQTKKLNDRDVNVNWDCDNNALAFYISIKTSSALNENDKSNQIDQMSSHRRSKQNKSRTYFRYHSSE